MTRLAKNSRRVGLALLPLGLALAACGSSPSASSTSKYPPSQTAGQPSSTTPSNAPSLANMVRVKASPNLGSILADSSGFTLYTLTKNGAGLACSGLCLTYWPPLTVGSAAPSVKGPAGITLSTTPGPGATFLVTANGLALYHFVNDKAAADTLGEGVASFGGVWHVVNAGAAQNSNPAPTGATAPTQAPTSAPPSGGYRY
ncbi:MAG: COG4315 family predicted lipoprotein [Acidimicrobiales bacterium]